jgi:hypothetical protein
VLNGAQMRGLGDTVAVAYNFTRTASNPLCSGIQGISLVGDDMRLRYCVCDDLVSVGRCDALIRSRHIIYEDALSTRLAVARAGLLPPPTFDCLRTIRQLIGEDEPDSGGTGTPLLQAAQSVLDPAARATLSAAASTRSTWDSGRLQRRLADLGLDFIYREIERPIIDVAVDMMRNGVLVDMARLYDHCHHHADKRDELRDRIEELAGGEINVNEPHILADFLYGHLGIKCACPFLTGPTASARPQ